MSLISQIGASTKSGGWSLGFNPQDESRLRLELRFAQVGIFLLVIIYNQDELILYFSTVPIFKTQPSPPKMTHLKAFHPLQTNQNNTKPYPSEASSSSVPVPSVPEPPLSVFPPFFLE